MERCKYCGMEIGEDCDGVQTLQPNPFTLEIYDEIVEEWLCQGQYYEWCQEI